MPLRGVPLGPDQPKGQNLEVGVKMPKSTEYLTATANSIFSLVWSSPAPDAKQLELGIGKWVAGSGRWQMAHPFGYQSLISGDAQMAQMAPSNAFHTRQDAFPTLREPFRDPIRPIPSFPRPWKVRKRPKRAFFGPSKAHFGCFQGVGGLFCLFFGLSDSAKLFWGSLCTTL